MSSAGPQSTRKVRKPGRSSAAPQPGRTRRPLALWAQALMLGALVFAAHSNSFQSGLVFDNAAMIAHDPRIQAATFENAKRIFTEGYWAPVSWSGLYRPFTTLSYLMNYAVLGNGARPAGYH